MCRERERERERSLSLSLYIYIYIYIYLFIGSQDSVAQDSPGGWFLGGLRCHGRDDSFATMLATCSGYSTSWPETFPSTVYAWPNTFASKAYISRPSTSWPKTFAGLRPAGPRHLVTRIGCGKRVGLQDAPRLAVDRARAEAHDQYLRHVLRVESGGWKCASVGVPWRGQFQHA